jgi:hypothetical protein
VLGVGTNKLLNCSDKLLGRHLGPAFANGIAGLKVHANAEVSAQSPESRVLRIGQN